MDELKKLKEQRKKIDEKIKKQERDLLYKRDAKLVKFVKTFITNFDDKTDDEIMYSIFDAICNRANRTKLIEILKQNNIVSSRPSSMTSTLKNKANFENERDHVS